MLDHDDDPDSRWPLTTVLAEQHLWVDLVYRTALAPVDNAPPVPRKNRTPSNPEADAQLLAAVIGNDSEAARRALAQGANPNVRQKAHREPALVLAVTNQAEALVTLLMDAGADLDAATVKGVTALHRCLDNDRLDLAHRLIDAGADPDPVTRAGEHLIDLALGRMKQNPCPTVLAWLLDRGDRPNDSRKRTTWTQDVLTITINTQSSVLLAALGRTREAPDQASGAQVLDTVGLDLIEKAWEMALDRDSVPALRMFVEHGWIPGLRCSDHDHRDPTFKGLSWGWLALLKNAGQCLKWALQMPQVGAMMADDAQRFPRKTVDAMQRATEPTLTLLHGMGVPLDTIDESGRRLLRRLAMWNGLTKPLVQWSLQNLPSLMVLRDEDGASPLDLLHQSDGALARWCEDRLLRMEVDQTTSDRPVQPRPVRTRL